MDQSQPKDCFYRMNCTAVGCKFSHPPGFVPRAAPAVPAVDGQKKLASCKYLMNCTAVGCKFSHPPGFVPRAAPAVPAVDGQKKLTSCKYGMNCTAVGCKFSHPPGFVAPTRECDYGANCKNVDCAFTHPPTRPGICPNGHYCCGKSCLKLHAQTEFDKIFRQRGKLFGPKMSSIDEARKTHKAKILNLIRLAHDHPSNPQNAALSDELIKQLNAFDDTLTKILTTATKKVPKDVLSREIFRLNLALPALALRADIMSTVESNRFVIVQGATGSGKSTQLPQYVAELFPPTLRIICTQPRKVSATSLAERVAFEWSGGERKGTVGKFVGYHVGAARKSSATCRIEYVTEGLFLSKLLEVFTSNSKKNSTYFSNVGAVIIDEAHERSINCDLILGLLKTHATTLWPEMKVIVTSATLDKDKFSKYFMNAPVLQIPGRLYPVEIEYSQQKLSPTSNYLDEVIKKALQIHQSTRSDSGDILCFLTGQDEVIKAREKCATLIQKQKFSPAISLSLYGKQLPEEQNLVFEKSPPNTRKIVFATDVAETGLTIDGIRHVVDCGLCKESTYDPIRNVTVLSVQRICQSSAIQRAGRAGRTAPGACYRLYTEDDYEEMNPSQTPEILSNPLQLTVTNLMTMGIDATSFDWIEAPDRDALDCAKKDLTYLGAMEQTQGSRLELTTLGYLISNLQIDPGMARMMYYACLEGYGVAASTIVGLMSVSSNFYYRGTSNNPNDQMAAADKHQQFCHPLGDVVSMFQAYSRWEELMLSYQQARGDDVMGDLTGEGEEKDDGNGGDLDEDLNDLMMELTFDQPPPPPPADLPLEDDVEEDEEQADGMEFKNDLEIPPQQQPDDGEFLEETNISEIDDNSSVSSATSSAFTEMSTVTKEEEFKISKFAASKLAKKFCAENYLNGKSLSMAQSTKLDVIRNLKTFQASSLWSAHATQEKQPTPEIIQRLVLKGLFLNVSVQTFIPRGYEVLRNTIPTIGILSPGSSLVKASRSNEVTNLPQTPNDSSLFPQYVVYNTMMTTSRTFLNTVTPIEIDWILEECPLFHSEVIAPRLATCRCRRIEITDVKPDLIPGLFGKFQDKKRSLESLLNITLQYDGRSLLEVWCAQDQERLVEEIIREKLATLRRNGLEEIEEEIYVGKTRVVYGPGCVVETLLFENEFISIGFSLKGEVGEEIIRPLVARFGTLHLIESYFLVQEKKLEKEKRTGFRIYYKRKEDAKCAHNALNGEVINGEIISVSPGGIRSTSLHADTSSQLVMSWSCSPSTGNGFLDFPTHEAAMAVLGLSDQGSNCPHLVALGSSVKLSLWKSKPGQPSSTRLGIRGLYPHVDEYDLEAACMALSRSRHITIPFRVMINRGGDAASEQQPLLVEIAHLRSLIPLRHKVVTETSFFDHVHKGRAGLFIHHTEDDIATAIDIWRNNSIPIMWNGQPVRLFGEFKKKITIHVEVKKYFEGELNQLLTSLAQRNSVRSRWISSKATEAKKDQKICLTLTSSNLATLNSAMAQINDIIKFQIYTPTDPKGKELLFSQLGRKRLTEISNVAYLHWDNKLKIIKIFGTNEKIKAATKSLDEALSRLGELQKKEIFEIQRRKRKDVISAWHQLKGVLKETIATFQVGVHQIDVMGSAEALVELREWLAQRNFLVTKSADRRHAPHCPLDCDICGDVAENPTFYYRGCGHGGCQSCLANQFSQSEITLPVVCPFDRQLLAISDINVLATAEAMKQYKTAALHKYVRENSNKVQCCPSPCCTQILQLPSSLVMPNEQEEIRSGGRVVAYCDECNMNYCLTCSQRDGKAVAAHPRYLCRETVEDCNDVTRFVQHITDHILTLHCPVCKMAFLDFTGCCAVTCHCGAYFCGICLSSQPSSSDCHSHVTRCGRNPNPGSYFCTQKQLQDLHRANRIVELKQYLTQQVPPALKKPILRQCEAFLQDLEIKVTDLL